MCPHSGKSGNIFSCKFDSNPGICTKLKILMVSRTSRKPFDKCYKDAFIYFESIQNEYIFKSKILKLVAIHYMFIHCFIKQTGWFKISSKNVKTSREDWNKQL